MSIDKSRGGEYYVGVRRRFNFLSVEVPLQNSLTRKSGVHWSLALARLLHRTRSLIVNSEGWQRRDCEFSFSALLDGQTLESPKPMRYLSALQGNAFYGLTAAEA